MNTTDYITAHKFCEDSEHLGNSNTCGCFYCLAIFEPKEIKETASYGGAICPKCGIDSVIGDSAYEITIEFLTGMHNYWFDSSKSKKD